MQWFKRLFSGYRNEESINKHDGRISGLEYREKLVDAHIKEFISRRIDEVEINIGQVKNKNKCLTDQINGILKDKEDLTNLLKHISKRVARLEIQHTRWFKKMSDDYSAAMMAVSSEASKFSIFATKQIEEKANELSKSVVSSMMESKDFMQLFSDLEFRMNERFVPREVVIPLSDTQEEEHRRDSFCGIIINGKKSSTGEEMAAYPDIIEWAGFNYDETPSVYYAYADGVAGELKKDGVMAMKEGLEMTVKRN